MAGVAGGGSRWRGRSVISKAVSLLDAFGPNTPELTLTDLARATGLPLSTIHRLASELVEWGGLERAAGSGYRIGTRLRELGALAHHGGSFRDTLRDVAEPLMHDLYEATGENVVLAVHNGHEALVVETIGGPETLPLLAGRDVRVPLHATGAGKVLLAHAPPAVLAELVEAGLPRYTPCTIVVPGQLRRALAEVRRTGIAYAREEMALGSLSVAAPVLGPDRTVVAALAVVLPAGRGDVRRLAAAVRTAAISTSRALQEHAQGAPAGW
jgi:DNA-binding IclR family transcriptional regulator